MAMLRGAAHARVAVQALIAATTIWWLLYWVLQPIPKSKIWLLKIDMKVSGRFLQARGSVFLLQALPITVIAFLSYFVIELRRKEKTQSTLQNAKEKPKLDIWTVPVFVRSPFGMLTLGDLTFIFAILSTVIWFVVKSSVHQARVIDSGMLHPGYPAKWLSKLASVGLYMGRASLIPFALLWIPVSRGSPILRAIGVPFERAVRYHIWLGSLTVWLIICHGILLATFFIRKHDAKAIITWRTTGVAVVPGVVALTAGTLMLCTALDRVRRKFFDLFFTVHHLYLVYLMFFAFHAVTQVYYVIIPVLLFFLDRFMRMVQSRKSVDVLSAKLLPSGAIELKFAKPARLSYHALSFVYVRLPSVSRLQWHPFSVASSPLDGTNQIAIYIKPLGGFTKDLHDALLTAKQSQSQDLGRQIFKCPFSFKVGLEGPYGSESTIYLKYKSLIMVAGGIGVTPFLAILRDILHRYRLQQEGLPTSIHLIFCVRHAPELHILDTLDPSSILPDFEECLNIKVSAYVTSTQPGGGSQASEDDTGSFRTISEDLNYINVHAPKLAVPGSSVKAVREMSAIASNGHSTWVASTVFATLVGFFVIWGTFNVTVLNSTSFNYVQALLYLVCIIVAVVPFGGGVMLLWDLSAKKPFGKSDAKVMSQLSMTPSPVHEDGTDIESSVFEGKPDSLWQGNVVLGRRPNWKEIFSDIVPHYEGQDVGVMVSGNHYMQQDIARECKHYSFSRASSVVLHYHSVSFEL